MAEPDYRNLEHWRSEQNKRLSTLRGGGGDGTFDDMEARVSNLEKRFDSFETKLDSLIASMAEVKGQLSAMPSASTFGDIKGALGELKGRVDSLPTTATIATIVGIFSGLALLITKWPELRAILGI